MSSRSERAKYLHKNEGCNCAQSIVVACSDMLNIDENTAFKITEGLGSGFAVGSMCGALSGAIMVISSYYSAGLEGKGSSKLHTYEKTKEFLKAFEDYNGYILCSDLKPKLLNGECKDANCNECVGTAVRIMEEIISE